jgi:hypothetical protein
LTSKPIVITMVTLLVLAVPAGVLGISQTAQGQPLGQDIANQVLDSVFGTNDDDGGTEEEDGATETEEEEEAITGDDNQDIDQTTEQTNDQDQTANQPITQESSQDETNIVDNDLETGDNSAIVAQANDATQEVTAAADASDADASAAASAESNDDDGDHHKKGKKYDGHYSGSSDSTSDDTTSVANAEAIVDAAAEATGIQGDQNNTADVDQDSSVHDVDLSNNVAFAEDTNEQIAVPISDQDQRAANLAEQRAANLDVVDIDEDGTGGTGTEPIRTFTCNPSTLAGIAVTRSGSTCSATGDTNIITGGVCDAVEGTRTVSGGQNPQATCSFPATAV